VEACNVGRCVGADAVHSVIGDGGIVEDDGVVVLELF